MRQLCRNCCNTIQKRFSHFEKCHASSEKRSLYKNLFYFPLQEIDVDCDHATLVIRLKTTTLSDVCKLLGVSEKSDI